MIITSMSAFSAEFKKAIDGEAEIASRQLRQELNQLRSNRPSPALVEDLLVDYYQSKIPLKQIAAISVVKPSTIVIEPWDKSVIGAIAQAISASSLQLAPIADGNTVRLTLPPLSEERRQQLIRLLHDYAENARIRMRQGRDRVVKKIDNLAHEKKISEDEKFKLKEQVQKRVDNFNVDIKALVKQKEQELST